MNESGAKDGTSSASGSNKGLRVDSWTGDAGDILHQPQNRGPITTGVGVLRDFFVDLRSETDEL